MEKTTSELKDREAGKRKGIEKAGNHIFRGHNGKG